MNINRQAILYIEAVLVLACFVMIAAIIGHKPMQTLLAPPPTAAVMNAVVMR